MAQAWGRRRMPAAGAPGMAPARPNRRVNVHRPLALLGCRYGAAVTEELNVTVLLASAAA